MFYTSSRFQAGRFSFSIYVIKRSQYMILRSARLLNSTMSLLHQLNFELCTSCETKIRAHPMRCWYTVRYSYYIHCARTKWGKNTRRGETERWKKRAREKERESTFMLAYFIKYSHIFIISHSIWTRQV